MNWFPLALIGIFSISAANVFRRVAMKGEKSDPLVSAIIFQFLCTIITGVYTLFRGFVAPPLAALWLNFLLSTVFYALGTLTYFRAAKKIGASEIAIISASSAAVTIVASIIFLSERFTLEQGIGTLIIIVSVVLVEMKKRLAVNSGAIYAALGASFYALAVVSDTYILRRYDPVSYATIMLFLPGVLLLVVQPQVVRKFAQGINRKYLLNMFFYSALYSVQAITYYMALSMGAHASQMGPIFKAEIILTILIAAIFIKERENLGLKIFSGVLATIGVLLIR